MSFEEELRRYLPEDLPGKERVVSLGARHLALIREMNQVTNLTRIIDEKEAAIKHVCDSVLPWRLFADAPHIVDAGTGAGFPGLPLSLVFPDKEFTLCESIQKKARFVASAVESLELKNVGVEAVRVEEWLRQHRAGIITARAVAPLQKMIPLLAPALRRGAHALLYKGPDVESEIAEARQEARAKRVKISIAATYDLPEQFGKRTIVALSGEG